VPDQILGTPPPASSTPPDQRVQDRDIETRAGWPTGHEMIGQLREALGLFAGAMPISSQRAWEEALAEVRRLEELQGEVQRLPWVPRQEMHPRWARLAQSIDRTAFPRIAEVEEAAGG